MADRSPHLLIVEARFYDDIADDLLGGAKAALAPATFAVVTVPGALDLPAASALALQGATRDAGAVAARWPRPGRPAAAGSPGCGERAAGGVSPTSWPRST